MGRWALVGLVVLFVAGCGPSLGQTTGSDAGTTDAISSTTTTSDGPSNEVAGGEPDPGTTASPGTTSTTTTTGIADSSDGLSFLLHPDGPGPTCDLFGDDCERGEKCMPWADDGGTAWNSTRCVPIAADPNGVDEACTVEDGGTSGIDDCDAGLMCWGVDLETDQGTCTAFCSGSADEPTCAEPCTVCVLANGGALALCLPSCNPIAPDCAPMEGCFLAADGFVCAPTAKGETEAALGEPCTVGTFGCAPGLTCVPFQAYPDCPGPSGCCTRYCDVDTPEGCPPGTTCTSLGLRGDGPGECGPAPSAVGSCTL